MSPYAGKVVKIIMDKKKQDATLPVFGAVDEQALGYIGASMGSVGVVVFAAIVVLVVVQKHRRRAKGIP